MCLTLLGVMVATWTVVTVTLRQRLVPNAMLGRVASAFRVSGLALTVAGAAAAGQAVNHLGFEGTLDAAAALIATSTIALTRPVLHLSADAATEKPART